MFSVITGGASLRSSVISSSSVDGAGGTGRSEVIGPSVATGGCGGLGALTGGGGEEGGGTESARGASRSGVGPRTFTEVEVCAARLEGGALLFGGGGVGGARLGGGAGRLARLDVDAPLSRLAVAAR